MSGMMRRKPAYSVYVEEGPGGAYAHVAELPGCFGVGSTASRAVAATPGAITAFLAWLKAHREPLVSEAHVSRPSMVDLYVAEVRLNGSPSMGGSYAALFEYDKAEWNEDRVERTIRWMGYSRADLLQRLGEMSDAQAREHEIEPGRSLFDTLWHIANAEYGYVNRVAGPLPEGEQITDLWPADLRERLQAIRAVLEKHVRALPPDRRSVTVFPTWANRPDEPWTLPKALRRALEHEREHLAEIS